MMQCLLCGGATQPLFTSSDGAVDRAEPFTVVWCHECEFGRLAGEFSIEQVRDFYPDDYYTHSTADNRGHPSTLADRAIVHLAWRVDKGRDFDPAEITSGASVCDIGCGNGAALRRFKKAGYKTTGIEPDAKARSIASDAGTILPGTAEKIPIAEQFDVVLMSHVLEHCIDPVKAVGNAASLLDPNGTLVIEVPNNAALGFWWFEGAWPWTDIPRHLSFFTDKSLDRILTMNGLRITQTVYTGYTRQFLPAWRNKIKIASSRSGWPLLLSSAFAGDRRKYDSIRVHAVKS